MILLDAVIEAYHLSPSFSSINFEDVANSWGSLLFAKGVFFLRFIIFGLLLLTRRSDLPIECYRGVTTLKIAYHVYFFGKYRCKKVGATEDIFPRRIPSPSV